MVDAITISALDGPGFSPDSFPFSHQCYPCPSFRNHSSTQRALADTFPSEARHFSQAETVSTLSHCFILSNAFVNLGKSQFKPRSKDGLALPTSLVACTVCMGACVRCKEFWLCGAGVHSRYRRPCLRGQTPWTSPLPPTFLSPLYSTEALMLSCR